MFNLLINYMFNLLNNQCVLGIYCLSNCSISTNNHWHIELVYLLCVIVCGNCAIGGIDIIVMIPIYEVYQLVISVIES